MIPARDDAAVLEKSLDTLVRLVSPQGQIHIVADHCQDATAEIARSAGATVHIRSNGGPVGKGPALRCWLDQTHDEASPHQVIIVLDADSQIASDFIPTIKDCIARGAVVAQARVEPSTLSKTPVAQLAALSEIIEQRVYDAIRSRLGWHVRLRGTGMAFRRSALKWVSASLHTSVEDVELTVLLAAARVPISFVTKTFVIDPKPEDKIGAIRQRARWLKGQFQVLRSYPMQILRLMARGPLGWSLLRSMLFKPRMLILPVKLVFIAWTLSLAAGSERGWWVWAIFTMVGMASILFDCFALLYSLRFTKDVPATLYALTVSPIYFLLWLRSLALALISRQPWLRNRYAPINQSMSEIGSVR